MNFRHLAINKIAYLKLAAIAGFFILVAFFTFFLWNFFTAPVTINDEVKDFQKAGESALADLQALPVVNLLEEGENYVIQDNLDEGIEISYPNQVEDTESVEAKKTKISLPKDYAKPIEIKLDSERTITLKDDNGGGYSSDVLTTDMAKENATWLQKILGSNKGESQQSYLRYQNGRKSILYSYQRERATGERKLKNFIFYEEGDGEEQESYTVENARLEKASDGSVKLFYQTEQDLKNQAAAKEVDPSLMDRAMKTLENEGVNQNQNPDLLIPKPYYYDKDGNYQEAEWEVQDNKLTLSIKTTEDKYPLAVDPTLSFTAPGISNGGVLIQGDASTKFGVFLSVGDLNADGKTDLVVGANTYSTSTGRVYIFYNDGNYSGRANGADVVITGEGTSNYFGRAFIAGDVNADGKDDLVVGAYSGAGGGRTYIFYNDSFYPTAAASADVIITGETSSGFGGWAFVVADFNADGEKDIAVGAYNYSTTTGRVYLFYADGTSNFGTATCSGTPAVCSAANADVIITGEATTNYFSTALTAGDFNADGKVDLAVGAYSYSSNTGRAYIFYNGSIITENASGADVIITGETTSTNFGWELAAGDMNADGEIDLIVGAILYTSSTGRAYIFYNGSIITENASGADVIITGETTTNRFGYALTVGDFNADGRVDLAVSASYYSTNTGRVYIFYNDGSIPTTAATADVVITGAATSDYFGGGDLMAADFNTDSKTDLVVGSYESTAEVDKVHIFYSQNGVLSTNQNIVGEATSDDFGNAFTAGDLNADGRTDLVVAASNYSTAFGRVYIFYNDGSISATGASADVIISAEATSNSLGGALTTGDLNADGKVDLVVGAVNYSTNTGRTYIFYNGSITTENASGADVIITGNATGEYFGESLTTGDLNADGEVDLVVGTSFYTTNTGRVYIFYNGSITTEASSGADVIISGQTTTNSFGVSLATGDLNADGKVDLVVGAYQYSTSSGRVYIFYADGTSNFGTATCSGTPAACAAANADILITGEATSNFLGTAVATGDLNADGKVDLVAGARNYTTATGRVYIFYNGSITTEAASGADVIITGETTSTRFGDSLTIGDLNADGKTDLVVGAYYYTTQTGRVYIFYNDGSIPTTAATADVIMIGETTGNYFGFAFTISDFDTDGETDLVVGAYGNSTNTGKVYFYEGQRSFSWQLQRQALSASRIYPNVLGEEITVTGGAYGYFGYKMAAGDLNADGATDIVISAPYENTTTGRVYIFYSDGSYGSSVPNADVAITGQATGDYFGYNVATGDLNADGKTDLIVGTQLYATNTGRVYIFYNDGSYPGSATNADVFITGEATSGFSSALTTGDFNADGKVDLAVGAYLWTTSTGRSYVFYNDGTVNFGTVACSGTPAACTAANADAIISGQVTSDNLGWSLAAGDFNADGKTDLAVGAHGYDVFSNNGRAYVFYNGSIITENASGADVFFTGAASADGIGYSLAAIDINFDGETDLVAGGNGKVFIYYNDGTYGAADVTITSSGGINFGGSMTEGDLNADGRVDLVVGADSYSSLTGRAYIFYNDGSIPTTEATADVMITGQGTSNYFATTLVTGDFNLDGKIDLATAGKGYLTDKGRMYIYTMNDSATAGESSSAFGTSLTTADFNADGKVDLAVGAYAYSGSTGRTYVFYGGSALDVSASSADVIITGESSSQFGNSLVASDLNADGKADLAVGANGYNPGGAASTGRAYIFYNGSIITEAATGADVIITGTAASNNFGYALTTGDLNADGEVDLAVGAYGANAAYIFYNDGSYPTTAGTANVTITGASDFGISLTTGDLNADGEVDLAVGAYSVSSSAGAIYIFYNDGSIPTTAGTADITITGEASSRIGYPVITGDFNADGKTDLASAAYYYSSVTGRVYIFHNDGSIPTTAATADVIITGETASDNFGSNLASGDLNADGRTDLAIGAHQYSSGAGRSYTFYNDGSIPTTAAAADIISTGGSGSLFGWSLTVGDLNQDSIADLVVGASNSAGKVHILITEITTPTANSTTQTSDGNEITASVKGGTIKVKGGTIKVK